jgi:thiamine-phosphate pyrophosphorylase
MLIYVISDRGLRPDLPPETMIDAIARSGADRVQVREKDLPGAALLALTRRAVAARGADVYVNGRADVALVAGAAGVHLPADGAGAQDVARAWPGRLAIGVSTHTMEEAMRAQAAGADFVTFGPVFDTPAKRGFGPPVGIEALERVCRAVAVPVLAIGGINAARLRLLAGIPIAGIAVISAVVTAPDMAAAVARLREEAAR